MKPRICICCGESIARSGPSLSRNPNVCASCSSMADGMEESAASALSQVIAVPAASTKETIPDVPSQAEEILPEEKPPSREAPITVSTSPRQKP